MIDILSTTNSVNDWLGIFGMISIAVMGLVWRMEKLWYDKIRDEVYQMIKDAKIEVIKEINSNKK